MKTYPIIDNDGRIHAFEIGNFFISRKGVLKIISGISGTAVTLRPKLFAKPPQHDVFCRFIIEGQEFTVEEPWGDNSRYLISADPPGPCRQMDSVEKVFSQARL